jgi:hypothetical protein
MGDKKCREKSLDYNNMRKVIAFDEAISKLKQAGLAEKFVAAIEKDEELVAAIEKITPRDPSGPMADWSCCVTVNDPLRTPIEVIINPWGN